MSISNITEVPDHLRSLPLDFIPPAKRLKAQPGPVDFTVLGDDQMEAAQAIMDFIDGKGEDVPRMLCIQGYAGTGKSFTMGKIINWLLYAKKLKVASSAPTNKAVQVCRDMCDIEHGNLTFATIHSLLGLKMVRNEVTGKEEFKPNPIEPPSLQEYDVLLIDETSMYPDELFDYVNDIVEGHGLKVIFIGDPAQIPPVNHIDCIPFLPRQQKKHGIVVKALTTVRRQKNGNPILDYATAIREQYKNSYINYPLTLQHTAEGAIVPIKKGAKDIIYEICETYFANDIFKQYPDFMKVIAYRNITVDAINRKVRTFIFNDENVPALMIGEKMIADKPVLSPEKPAGARFPDIILTTNQEFEVIDYRIKELRVDSNIDNRYFLRNTYQYYETDIKTWGSKGDKVHQNIRIMHEDSAETFNKDLAGMKAYINKMNFFDRKRGWKAYFSVEELFAKVKYNYAITAHKAQGSTYQNCMVLEWDIQKCFKDEERHRILYTAVTRAVSNLFIVTE